MNRLNLAALVAWIPLIGFCQEAVWQSSPVQAAPGNQFVSVAAHEYRTRIANVRGADVHITIVKPMDRTPIPTSNIQQLRILDTDGRPIEFTDRNPGELQFESVVTGNSSYTATYELVDSSRIRRLGEVRFGYLGRNFVFDMRASEPIPDDDPELAEVQIGGSRIRPKTGFDGTLCNPETYVETRLTPEQQAAETADPVLRRGREAAEQHLIADMIRTHSVLPWVYEHSEEHGDEIWFFYSVDYRCSNIMIMTHGRVIMSWNRKTGEIQVRKP